MTNFLFLILSSLFAHAEQTNLPLWEYGLGLGYVHFAHYPASNQSTDLLLPFPTFQYRGNIIRANDREGTRAYIIQGDIWSLEFSGNGLPALNSSNNEARTGMPDLPWMAHMGPQIIGHLTDSIEFKFSVFQAISTDFKLTKTNGQLFTTKFIYKTAIKIYDIPSFGFFALELKSASSDYLATYFEVDSQFSNTNRPSYHAKSGFMSAEIQYYQAMKMNRTTFYVGISHTDYYRSANADSPLHQSNQNISGLLGLTYTLSESKN